MPDLPWILQRVVAPFDLPLPPYDTRLYLVAQASLLCSLLLCGALALLSAKPRTIFLLLAGQATLHLLLDAAQTKWGNGVHLFLPVRWEQVNLGWFWPESPITHALTALGLGFVLWAWTCSRGRPLGLGVRNPVRIAGAAGLLLAYALVPLVLIDGLEQSDSHSVRTLRDRDRRPGRAVAFDRRPYRVENESGTIEALGRERITVLTDMPLQSGVVSLRGVFVSPDTLRAYEVHRHEGRWRDYATYAGLTALLLFWMRPRRQPRKKAGPYAASGDRTGSRPAN